MKTITALIFATVALCAFGQPSELICFNPPAPFPDPIAIRSDVQDIQPLLAKGRALTEAQLEGLSIEEAALALPEILNNTAITLYKEGLASVIPDDQFSYPNPGDMTLVAFQSIVNTTNGVEIFNTMIQDPDNFVRAFILITQNFDFDCIDNPEIIFLTLVTTMMADLLQEPFRDSFVDILNTTTIEIAIRGNYTDAIVSVLQPLSENLDDAEDVGGALGSLLSFVTEDAITAALSSALGSSGFILEPERVGAVLSAFFARIQSSFEIDGQEFVSFINEIFKNILDALN